MRALLCVFWLGWVAGLTAEEQRFAFALPEEEGRISLGVFDDKGVLVRTLAVAAEIEDFAIGLNGLIASWDGQTDLGGKAPAGKYFVRGFVVGENVKTEGVAYHFNDWVEDEETVRVAWIENFQLLADGSLILAAAPSLSQKLPPVLIRYAPGRGVLWNTLLDPPLVRAGPLQVRPQFLKPAPFLATGAAYRPETFLPLSDQLRPFGQPHRRPLVADEASTVVAVGPNLHILATETGRQILGQSAQAAPPRCFALEKETLWVGALGGVTELALPECAQTQVLSTPVSFDALARVDGQLVGGVRETEGVWRQEEKSWRKLDLPLTAGSVSAGKDKTFWVAGRDPVDGAAQVGEFGLDGEFHSSYRGELPAIIVSAAGSQVGVLEENASRQRLIILEKNLQASEQPWEIVFEKSIERSHRFAVEGSDVKADGPDQAPPATVKLVLEGHGLDTASREVAVKLLTDRTGLWLATASGLKIVQVSETPTPKQRLALRKGADTITAYAGDGTVVEEFAIRDLESQLAPLEAGEIDLP